MRKVKETISAEDRGVRASFAFSAFWLFLVLVAAAPYASAQDGDTDDPAPPPLRIISKTENAQLNAETNTGRRSELALQLMDLRLKRAEALKNSEEYDAMLIELGSFHGLIDNTLGLLHREQSRSGKALNALKKYEMALRKFPSRLELIRRDLPDRYGYHLIVLLRALRDARSKALEPFFGSTVLPEQ